VLKLADALVSAQPTSHSAMQCLVRTLSDVRKFEAGQQREKSIHLQQKVGRLEQEVADLKEAMRLLLYSNRSQGSYSVPIY